jgi:hypothetical protein
VQNLLVEEAAWLSQHNPDNPPVAESRARNLVSYLQQLPKDDSRLVELGERLRGVDDWISLRDSLRSTGMNIWSTTGGYEEGEFMEQVLEEARRRDGAS